MQTRHHPAPKELACSFITSTAPVTTCPMGYIDDIADGHFIRVEDEILPAEGDTTAGRDPGGHALAVA